VARRRSVADHLLVSPQNLAKLLFHDPSKPEVKAKLAMPEGATR